VSGRGIEKQIFNNNKKMSKEIKDEDLTTSPACTKPPVVGSTVYLMDCVAGMKEYPDKWFDLALADPPYGIGEHGGKIRTNKKRPCYELRKETPKYKNKGWDLSIPDMEYFTELFRVSKNQIIFGANYFTQFLPASMGWIFWDKKFENTVFSDGEFIYTSFSRGAKKFVQSSKAETNGGLNRIHPTQKTIKLYDFCLQFAKVEPGMRIIDTHLGSQSSRIAADKAGLDFTGFEIDKDYFDAGEKRYQNYKSQLRIEGW